ncbi:hypothetical protein H5V28_06115 [Escherichia coli]|nr:hypothetical protein [Escherichia coli]MBZ9483403.1 hypothetical protein [Escherichia coli]
MSEYDTGNPVPSASIPDAWDNMQSIDRFANSSDETITTRTGKQLDTLHGINVKADSQRTEQQDSFELSQSERESSFEEKSNEFESRFSSQLSTQESTFSESQTDKENRFQQFLLSSGYVFLGDYGNGPFQFSARNQYIRYDNEYYRLNAATDVGFTTTGTDATSFANDVTHFFLMDGDTLRQNLGSGEGQLLVGSPRHLADLRGIFPGVSSRIKTLGAKWAYDGGAGEWWFDPSDMSELVSTYPRLFIAPTIDPSGASGAWRLNMGGDVTLSAFGVGISAELPAVMTALDAGIINPDIFLLENSGGMIASDADYQFNADVLNQFNAYAKGKKYARLPTGKVFVSELNFSYDPKFDLEWGVNSELASTRNLGSIDNGTVFIARDADSANPVITIAGTEAKRLSGIYMRNVAIVSKDLFDNRDLTIPAEWNVRSNRPALKLDYIASAIDIGTLTICGFKQALLGSELWDGSIRRLTVSICSDPDGTVPAVWLGSQHGDNSNALKFYDMRIEHCPFSLECGFIEHVRFINGKIETKRKKDATHYVVKINDNATRYHFDGMQFVTTPTTKTPYLYDQGQWPVYNECDFTVGGIVGNYPGVRWIYRNPTRTSVAKFKALTITGPMQADGADPAAYPMYLADYDEFGGSIQCQDTYTIDGAAVYPSYQGLICMGTGTKMGSLHINTNNITKTAGSVFYARGGDYDIGKPTITGAPHNLLAGVKNDIRKMITSSPDIEIYRRETILLNPGTTLNSMKGFEGQVIRIMTFGTGCTITHSSLINNSSGANISMTANTVYTFMMLTGTVAKQI